MEKSNNGQAVRRSARIRAKTGAKINKPDLSKYTEHIETLHGVAGDLLMMMDTLDRENLRNIIREYENIVGELLGVGR
tara:strand:+ start:413 stop:646 length:234 start_codon:yes stop_codon:yes gene_type:complete